MLLTLVRFGKRSAWKGPYFVALPGIEEAKRTNTPIRTNARQCTILPNFVGLKLLVHNGLTFLPVDVTEEMVGYKIGDFAHTKKAWNFKAGD